jgi:hypothetical protein
MDPISAAASVIALIQISDRIISLYKAKIIDFHDTPDDLRAILIEVGSVKCVLKVIELLGQPQPANVSANIFLKLTSPLKNAKKF